MLARTGLLSDLARIERLGRAHHQVIARVAADGPVLPLRLATVYPDDHTVRTLLARGSAGLAVMLESFRGTQEWGVRIYAGAPGAAPGAAEACAEMIGRAPGGIAVATRRQPVGDFASGSNAQCLVLHAAYLLSSDRAEEFTAVARALGRVQEGVRTDLTGPWPPYSFADLHQP